MALGRVQLGAFVNAYLVRSGESWAVVDTGPPGSDGRILSTMHAHGIDAAAVRLILLTHGHFDHYGSALRLRRRLGAQVRIAMHRAVRPFLSGERVPAGLRPTSAPAALSLFAGTAYFYAARLFGAARPWSAADLDEVLWLDGLAAGGPPLDLSPACGFEARALPTPGHSPGSVSLFLPTGEAVTGDLISQPGFGSEPGWPMPVEEPAQVLPSIRAIAGQGATMLFPGHGKPFSGASLEKFLTRAGSRGRS